VTGQVIGPFALRFSVNVGEIYVVLCPIQPVLISALRDTAEASVTRQVVPPVRQPKRVQKDLSTADPADNLLPLASSGDFERPATPQKWNICNVNP